MNPSSVRVSGWTGLSPKQRAMCLSRISEVLLTGGSAKEEEY